jgi:hypothetical protein
MPRTKQKEREKPSANTMQMLIPTTPQSISTTRGLEWQGNSPLARKGRWPSHVADWQAASAFVPEENSTVILTLFPSSHTPHRDTRLIRESPWQFFALFAPFFFFFLAPSPPCFPGSYQSCLYICCKHYRKEVNRRNLDMLGICYQIGTIPGPG